MCLMLLLCSKSLLKRIFKLTNCVCKMLISPKLRQISSEVFDFVVPTYVIHDSD